MISCSPLQVSIGRLESNTLTIADTEVSSQHVTIRWDSNSHHWQVGSTWLLHVCPAASRTPTYRAAMPCVLLCCTYALCSAHHSCPIQPAPIVTAARTFMQMEEMHETPGRW